MLALAAAAIPALGPKWMDPAYLLDQYGDAFFWIALAIVFIECGLLFPILPGDSLLFAVGLFIATGQVHINLGIAIVALCVAAFLGNVVGYEIGRALGTPLYHRDGRFLKKKYFDETTAFFDKHGNKALVIGRFVPIVRTFITVVAGVSRMDRHRFFTWSAVGAVLWVTSITLLGYFLGKSFPGIADKLEIAIVLIVAVSLLPMVIEALRHRRQARRVAGEADEAGQAGRAASSQSDSAVSDRRS
jgi:membrane-associated protein